MQELSKISNGVKKLTTKKKIPALPGVYFFKDSRGKIMYIGKAANLRPHRRIAIFQAPYQRRLRLLAAEGPKRVNNRDANQGILFALKTQPQNLDDLLLSARIGSVAARLSQCTKRRAPIIRIRA